MHLIYLIHSLKNIFKRFLVRSTEHFQEKSEKNFLDNRPVNRPNMGSHEKYSEPILHYLISSNAILSIHKDVEPSSQKTNIVQILFTTCAHV